MAGELVTTTFEYDGGRQVMVYVPPDPPKAVVFAGDRQLISQWGGDLEAAEVPPTMVVGAYRTDDPDEMARIGEYSPSFDAQRFAAHERFFVEDVRSWVRTRFGVALPAERTVVCGISTSGKFALAMGLRHLDFYGAIFCASPGGASTSHCDAQPTTAHLSRRRDAGAVVFRQRHQVGRCAALRRCGRGPDRADRRPQRPVLASRIPAHGGMGLRTPVRPLFDRRMR